MTKFQICDSLRKLWSVAKAQQARFGVRSLILPLIFVALSTQRLCAQAPGLLWTTNVGANVFAVDSQTNVYANANGTVITLNAGGQPFATNLVCPVPSVGAALAKMDLRKLLFCRQFRRHEQLWRDDSCWRLD